MTQEANNEMTYKGVTVPVRTVIVDGKPTQFIHPHDLHKLIAVSDLSEDEKVSFAEFINEKVALLRNEGSA